MARRDKWKYNYYHKMEDELFDLENDPQEKNNIINNPYASETAQNLLNEIMQDWNPEEILSHIEKLSTQNNYLFKYLKATKPYDNDIYRGKLENNWLADQEFAAENSDALGGY
jgi:choline-sulfatase